MLTMSDSSAATVQQWLELQVEKQPDAKAIVFNEESLTYCQFNERVNQLAYYLRSEGIKPDMRVALAMERSCDLIITLFAILKAGGAYVPMDPSHPEERLLLALNGNDTPFLIIHSPLKEKFSQYHGKLIVLDDTEKTIRNYPIDNPVPSSTPDNLAYVIYTSGSTGKPKGVLIEQHSLVNYCRWFSEYSVCCAGDRIDFSSNYAFDMAVTNTILSLMLGLTIVICNDETKKDLRNYLKFLNINRINFIKITPSYFNALILEIKNNFIALPDLKTIILGGENLCHNDCSSWLDSYPKHLLVNEYGPTETTVAVSTYHIDKNTIAALGSNIPIGKPGHNISFHLLNKAGNIVKKGEVGELHIGGDCLARGYLMQPGLTEQRFIHYHTERLYKTGDLCRELPDSNIEYLGRIDHQIKLRGFRIELSEIEQVLISHRTIKNTVVLAREIQPGNLQLVAYCITDSSLNADELKDHLKNYLPEYMIPIAFIAIPSLPLTANGKLDREALPLPILPLANNFSAPTTPLEILLANSWSTELAIPTIGLHDNFFELGGHSLSAARIISVIKQKTKKNISLKDLYASPTIEGLAKLLEKKPCNVITSTIKNTTAPNKIVPLSDFQLLLWLSNTFAPKIRKLNIIGRKRLTGKLDATKLTKAFELLFQKHQLLSFQVFKLKPAQCYQQALTWAIEETDISSLNTSERESALLTSIDDLMNYYPWPTTSQLIKARLFYLDNGMSELQLCIPHIISDGMSMNLIWTDLSNFYLSHQKKPTPIAQYRDYIANEQAYTSAHFSRDHVFWKRYLQETVLLTLPENVIVKKATSFSTYTEIPKNALTKLDQFSHQHGFSLNDALCASLGLAISRCSDNQNASIVMNSVKSTHEDPVFDESIGCFLRIEPIKLKLLQECTLLDYAHQIHQSVMNTALYQQASNILKLACINVHPTQSNGIKSTLIKGLVTFYRKLFPTLALDPNIFNLCGELAALNQRKKFIINVNLWNNFIKNASHQNETSLFGFNLNNLAIPYHDLLNINYVLDVCFLRDDNQIPYLVISGNLTPAFREELANAMIKIMHDSVNIDAKRMPNYASDVALPSS